MSAPDTLTAEMQADEAPDKFDEYRKRFYWALHSKYTEAEMLENIGRIQNELGRIRETIKEFKDKSFVPDPGETAETEKAALASYIDSLAEVLAGIGLALMLRGDFLPTEGIQDGPPAGDALKAGKASSDLYRIQDSGVVH